MEGCLYRIKQFSVDLSPSERKIADYLVTHPTQSVHMGVSEIARNSNSSPAAVVRLANRLGYKGYTELRLSLAKEVFSTDSGKETSVFHDITATSSVEDIVRIMIGLAGESIAGIESVLDRGELEEAVQIIHGARHVLLAGVGASGVVATDFQQKLARLGLLAIHTSDPDMQIVQSCALDERDVVIAISYSGESEAVLRVAKEAKKNGTKVVAITRVGENSLGKLADRILAVPNSESLFRQGATLSRINQLLVVDIVYATILSRIQEEASGIITRTWEAVSHVSGKDTSRLKN